MVRVSTLFVDGTRSALLPLLPEFERGEESVVVDLLLNGQDFLEGGALLAAGPRSGAYVLFAFDRVHVLRDRGAPGEACVECFMRYAIDNQEYPEVYELRAHYLQRGYRYRFDEATLSLLPLLLKRCEGGQVLTLWPDSGEVSKGTLVQHARCRSPWHAASKANEEEFPLAAREVGRSLREIPIEEFGARALQGLVSNIGPIRQERLFVNATGTVSCIARAGRNHGASETTCGGSARQREHARLIARCETLERLMMIFEPADSEPVIASYDEVRDRAVDPRRLAFELLGEGGAPKGEGQPISWTPAFSVTHQRPVLVPSQEVWASTTSEARAPGIGATSNGVAVGHSTEEAALHGFLELAERDAFVTSWHLRRDCQRLDPASVTDHEFQLSLAHTRYLHPGYALHFLDTTNDLGIPAVWLLAVRERGSGPKALATGSAALDRPSAMRGALRELASPFQKARRFEPEDPALQALLADQTAVSAISDHAKLYELDASFERLSFLDFNKPLVPVGEAPPVPDEVAAALPPSLGGTAPVRAQGDATIDLHALLLAIAGHLGRLGSELILKDMTTPAFARRGIRCVRAVAPDVFPISFGYARQRFSITDRVRRLATLYGTPVPAGTKDLNPYLHPFA